MKTKDMRQSRAVGAIWTSRKKRAIRTKTRNRPGIKKKTGYRYVSKSRLASLALPGHPIRASYKCAACGRCKHDGSPGIQHCGTACSDCREAGKETVAMAEKLAREEAAKRRRNSKQYAVPNPNPDPKPPGEYDPTKKAWKNYCDLVRHNDPNYRGTDGTGYYPGARAWVYSGVHDGGPPDLVWTNAPNMRWRPYESRLWEDRINWFVENAHEARAPATTQRINTHAHALSTLVSPSQGFEVVTTELRKVPVGERLHWLLFALIVSTMELGAKFSTATQLLMSAAKSPPISGAPAAVSLGDA